MESLSDTDWDVVISGTGLQQSLLALSTSRAKKKVLHVDSNEYYGGPEAALSLQDADEWAKTHSAPADDQDLFFTKAELTKADEGLSFSRAYSLALAPQIIHANSKLLDQLVSSKAFRQVEFLAVGSFYIYQASAGDNLPPSLSRIPSTREDVFSNTAISPRAKRSLMKFLKFVLDYESEPQLAVWKPRAQDLLTDFLSSHFNLDQELQSYIVTLTLSLDGKVSVEDGLRAITRHLTSMGRFGAGFAAVYPKWGGLSEVAQVGCRAGAVGGATYMLGSGVTSHSMIGDQVEVELSNGTTVKSRCLVQGSEKASTATVHLSRLTAILLSDLASVFQALVDGSPTPGVAIVAFPSGVTMTEEGVTAQHPVYAMIHSSETGECPSGQSIVYLSTIQTSSSKSVLRACLSSLTDAITDPSPPPQVIYELYYEQRGGAQTLSTDGKVATFPPPSVDLAFNDDALEPAHGAWQMVMSLDGEAQATCDSYMVFEDREGTDDDDGV